MRTNPDDFQNPGYRVGDGAWESWIAAVEGGHGSEHGHWWNAMVWAECRDMASKFFQEVSAFADRALCESLSGTYRRVNELLVAVSDRALPAASQKEALAKCRGLEAESEGMLRELLAAV